MDGNHYGEAVPKTSPGGPHCPISKKTSRFYSTPNADWFRMNKFASHGGVANRDQFIPANGLWSSRRVPPGLAGIAGAMKTSRARSEPHRHQLIPISKPVHGHQHASVSPTVVPKPAFGYTALQLDVAYAAGGQRNVVDELGIPASRAALR